MEENPNNKATSDDLDLRAFFSIIGKFFSVIANSTIKSIVQARRATLKNRILIGSLSVLGGCIGLYLGATQIKYYNSTLLIQSDYLNNKLVENGIQRLNKLVDKSNPSGLARELNISKSLAANIRAFDFVPFVTEDEVIEIEILQQRLENLNIEQSEIVSIVNQIEVQNRKAFEISVTVYQNETYDSLQVPVVNYFRNNPYIKGRIEINRRNLEDQKIKLTNELIQIDSLKRVLLRYIEKSGQGREGASNFILGDPTVSDPISVFKEDISLYRQLQQVEKSLFLNEDFEVIQSFITFQRPASYSLFEMISIGLLCGLSLSYVVIIIISINKFLSRYELSHSE